MNFYVPNFLLPLVAGVVFFFVCSRTGYFCDRIVNKNFKDRVRKRLESIREDNSDSLSRLLFTIFNRVFDPKDTGRPRFGRSSLASSLILLVMLLIWVLAKFDRLIDILSDSLFEVVLFVIVFAVPINVVGDYFSLWETRIVVGGMANVGGRKRQVLLLLLDLVASVIIFLFGLAAGLFVYLLGDKDLSIFLNNYSDIVRLMFSYDFLTFNTGYEPNDVLAICFYTTLLTSVWAWAFMLGATLWPLFKRMESVLDTQKSPVGVIMTIGGVPFSILIVVSGYLNLLIS